MIGNLQRLQKDFNEFYTYSIKNNTINKIFINKKYNNTKLLLNKELCDFREKKNKYDINIYIDSKIMQKKLENELKDIIGKFKSSILNNINIVKNSILEYNELDKTLYALENTYKNKATYNGKIIEIK